VSIEGKVKLIRQIENWKKKHDMCREFGLVNSTIQTIRKSRTKIIGAFEQNGSKLKRFRKPERSDVDEALLDWFKQHISDSVAMKGPLAMTVFFFLNFNLNYCIFIVSRYGNLQLLESNFHV
jgi:hypothetical protein